MSDNPKLLSALQKPAQAATSPSYWSLWTFTKKKLQRWDDLMPVKLADQSRAQVVADWVEGNSDKPEFASPSSGATPGGGIEPPPHQEHIHQKDS